MILDLLKAAHDDVSRRSGGLRWSSGKAGRKRRLTSELHLVLLTSRGLSSGGVGHKRAYIHWYHWQRRICTTATSRNVLLLGVCDVMPKRRFRYGKCELAPWDICNVEQTCL